MLSITQIRITLLNVALLNVPQMDITLPSVTLPSVSLTIVTLLSQFTTKKLMFLMNKYAFLTTVDGLKQPKNLQN